MRQAIEEGFILDVLQNYMTYKAYYQLEKTIEDDPQLSGRRGQRKVARYATLHATAIGQKVEIIVDGNTTLENAKNMFQAGASGFVTGTSSMMKEGAASFARLYTEYCGALTKAN